MIEFNCPFCSRKMKAPDEYAGKQGTCNSCKHFVIVPRPDSSRVLPSIPVPKPNRWQISYRVVSRVVYAAIAAGLIGLFLWKYFGTHTDEYTAVNGAHVRQLMWNWSGEPYYRYVTMKDSNGEYVMTANGPVSSSGKMHGHWSVLHWGVMSRMEDAWYWYGEEITEGEWHLRNK